MRASCLAFGRRHSLRERRPRESRPEPGSRGLLQDLSAAGRTATAAAESRLTALYSERVHDDLGNFSEVLVRRQDPQPVLHGGRRDPDVVRRNWTPGRPQEIQNDRVSVGRLLVKPEDPGARRGKKLDKLVLVSFSMAAPAKARFQLTQDNRVDRDLVGLLHCAREPRVPAEDSRGGGGVEKDPAHFQSSGSIFR